MCQKPNCRSWKHTDEERSKARDEYRTRLNSQTNGRYNNRFKERFEQYVVECEGDKDSEDEFEDVFDSFVADINAELDLDTEPKEAETSRTYFTTIGSLTSEDAIITSTELSNKALNHAITARDVTFTASWNEDPFTYSNDARSRYTSSVFMGIMIDTGASTKSTARYGQYEALRNVDSTAKLDVSTKGRVSV